MSLRKRLEDSLERRAQARAKRREERRRAERAKRAAAQAKAPRAERKRAGAEAKSELAKRRRPEAKSRKPERSERPAAKRERPARGPKAGRAGGRPRAAARKRAKSPASAQARKLGAGAASVGTELVKLGREVLVVPAQLWLAGAEIAGDFVLKVWRRALRPALVGFWRLLIAALAFAARHLTPARAVAAVALVAAGALIASQWLDYHSVSVGTDAYSGDVGVVAPAPEVETEIAGNAHAWVMVPLGLAAIAVLGFALTKRRRAAALLAPIGVLVIAIALIIDLPKGLDEGAAAIAYDGAEASLLEGFWLEIATGAVLIASGLMLRRYLRPRPAQARTELTGPSLVDRAVSAARERARRPSKHQLPRVKRPRPKRKVQGART